MKPLSDGEWRDLVADVIDRVVLELIAADGMSDADERSLLNAVRKLDDDRDARHALTDL